jgi:molybdenum cofactor biosynthesis enzyme MoaA
MNTGHYLHPAGEPSRGAVLDTGLKCLHSCLFCYYRDYNGQQDYQALRKGGFRSAGDSKRILDLFVRSGYRHFDITGGEPSLHPDIVDIVRYGCTNLALAGRLITLGQYLLQKTSGGRSLLDTLLDAGLTDVLFSLHSADAESFNAFTNGSLKKLTAAMDYFDRKGFQYGTNTVVFEGNRDVLPDIAALACDHGVYIHNFIMFNAYHGWSEHKKSIRMQPRYDAVRPYIEKAVQRMETAGIAVNIRYTPYCVVKGFEKHIVGLAGVFYDPFEWRNRACNYGKPPEFCAEPISIEHTYALRREEKTLESGWQIIATRGDNLKVFPEVCGSCAAIEFCDGLSPSYLGTHGGGELSPYDSFAISNTLPITRLEYDAPFHVKTSPMEDMREIISRSKP